MRTPALTAPGTTVYLGDCLDVLAEMEDASIDAIVTDPPYGLGFMGKAWDDLPPGLPWAQECLRVLKPGGHLLAFGGSRTWHRLAIAVEDAGFEIRDSIAWLYGNGFPKSLDVSKAIDKAEGYWRGKAGKVQSGNGSMGGPNYARTLKGDPVTAAAAAAAGWGTALKPAFEPIVVGRKPLIGTVAANVLEYGTGGLNIDGCRVGTNGGTRGAAAGPQGDVYGDGLNGTFGQVVPGLGRWPANVVLDGSQADALDAQSGTTRSRRGILTSSPQAQGGVYGGGKGLPAHTGEYGFDDSGGASRFFPTFRYQGKAPTSERPRVDGLTHPTVKPVALMRWLVRLVTPRGGVVLDTFAGSGATLEAAVLEGFESIGIEREPDYLPLIGVRLDRTAGLIDRDRERDVSAAAAHRHVHFAMARRQP